jgi:hypothetical protein
VPTHYQRLGVRPSASTEEIRVAYRSLARRLHPDRLGDASGPERALAERRMREVNEAWSVLSDPARRRAYDLERSGGTGPGSGPARRGPARGPAAGPGRVVPAAEASDDDLVDVAPVLHGPAATLARHLPWLVLVVVLGIIFVATAYAGGGSGDAPTATTAVAEGTCIDLAAGPVTTPVDCAGPHDLRIVARVDAPESCPVGTEARRFAADGLVDCVAET